MNCPFCDSPESPPNGHGEIITYTCGTLTNNPEPRTKNCTVGYIRKLFEAEPEVEKDEKLRSIILAVRTLYADPHFEEWAQGWASGNPVIGKIQDLWEKAQCVNPVEKS